MSEAGGATSAVEPPSGMRHSQGLHKGLLMMRLMMMPKPGLWEEEAGHSRVTEPQSVPRRPLISTTFSSPSTSRKKVAR